MKKIITALIISAFVIVLGGTAVFAAGWYFTDADADGICDYRNTDCYAEYNYSNADNRTGICPCNNSCTPKYRHHANGNEDAGQPGHREHHGGFRFPPLYPVSAPRIHSLLHPEPDPLPSGTGAAILYREHRKRIHTRQSRARVCPLSGYSPPPGTGAAVCPCHRTSKPALRSLLPV